MTNGTKNYKWDTYKRTIIANCRKRKNYKTTNKVMDKAVKTCKTKT